MIYIENTMVRAAKSKIYLGNMGLCRGLGTARSAIPIISIGIATLARLKTFLSGSRPEGRIILTTLSMVAEMELTFIKERQRAGIDAARAMGVYKGRKKSIDREAVRRLRAEGVGATETARCLGIGRASVYKVLAAVFPGD
jgi:hypothetical protein